MVISLSCLACVCSNVAPPTSRDFVDTYLPSHHVGELDKLAIRYLQRVTDP